MLSVIEAAERLGVTDDHILNLIHLRALLAVNVALPGKARPRWKIPLAAIEAFETSRTVAPPAPRPAARRKPAVGIVRHYR